MSMGEPKVPCYFIFGDSLVDSGNNNNLETVAKSELLGFDDFIPSFLSVNSSEILKGVNYASGSAGIRQETEAIVDMLGKRVRSQPPKPVLLLTLYNSGARKVAVNGIGPIGCAPYSTANYDTKGSLCVDYMNDASVTGGVFDLLEAVRSRDGKNLILDLILSEVFATADT
ncbi:hypothetical protein NC653_029187 [Populus alba x Populus x berolinensis]|uniref:GDSL esterase/lipase EXL3 n=1 Tax=Populus alba x Populus x berolinensis TaxID=444605 RepID=A0AAD6Q455_9ROSI|nr:hypothetical protein NC653_029187 [Populus alba x Populus x berolinensis]